MMRRTLIAVFLLLASLVALGGSTPEVPPTPAVLQASDAEVKKLTEDLQKAVGDKNDELLAKAIEEMETLRHDSFVPFIRGGLKSADSRVLAASIRAAATHELKDIQKDVVKLLHAKPGKPKDKDAKDNAGLAGEVGSAAIDYLRRLDVAGEEATVLDDYLDPLVTPTVGDDRRVKTSWARDLMRACIHYLGKYKYKRAVPLLIELVGEPRPKPFNPAKGDPNPPESYFKGRSDLWHAGEGWVRWALKETTAQEFRSAREWEAWLKLNKKDFK